MLGSNQLQAYVLDAYIFVAPAQIVLFSVLCIQKLHVNFYGINMVGPAQAEQWNSNFLLFLGLCVRTAASIHRCCKCFN